MELSDARTLRDMLSIIIAACKDKGITNVDIRVDGIYSKVMEIKLLIPQVCIGTKE